MKPRTSRRRAAAVLFALTAAGLAVFALVVGPLTESGTQDRDVADITAYDVDMNLSADGTLVTDESITVSFPVPRRGIFRIFDTADPRRDSVEHPVESLEVWRDGQPEPWTYIDSARGTTTARIGRADQPLPPGEYTYRLRSSTRDVLEPDVPGRADDPDTTWWWWDVIGSGWPMPIQNVSLRVNLPAEATSVECVIGDGTRCDPTVDGTTLTLSVGALSPNEPVTLRVGMPADEVPPNTGSGGIPIVFTILAGLVGLALGVLGVRATRERAPGYPVLYEPPPGIRPAVGVRVLDEKASGDELQATLFDLGDRQVVAIEPDGDKWRVRLVGDPIAARCEPWELKMLARLDLRTVGDTFTVSKSVTAGKAINKAKESLDAGAGAAVAPFLTSSGIGWLVRITAWLAWIGVAAMAGFHFFGGVEFPAPLIVGVGGYAVAAALAATDVGVSTTRTEAGRDVWSRTGGFARFLATDSSESRFDAAAHMDWFPHYLPWAVALGVSDEWAKRYEAQGVATPEVPYVYGWGLGYGYSSSRFADFNSSFNGAIASASAAYAASQTSSGGGGGFSGGSGGGGGGGGSW